MNGVESLPEIIRAMGINSQLSVVDFEALVKENDKFEPVIVDLARELNVHIKAKDETNAKMKMTELIRIGKMGKE